MVAGVIWAAWAGPLTAAAPASGGIEPASAESYVVRGGDTLWDIAAMIAPGRDPRPVVDAISRANDVDPGALVPGQTLVIPGV